VFFTVTYNPFVPVVRLQGIMITLHLQKLVQITWQTHSIIIGLDVDSTFIQHCVPAGIAITIEKD
jgi:hypothetical protein